MPEGINNKADSFQNPEKGLLPSKKTLIVGYGNPDREDDGVAWYILLKLAKAFNLSIPAGPEVGFIPEGRYFDILFDMQLMPEMAEEMLGYERLCFIDAHTGALNADLNWQPIEPIFQNSPLTHHMTPQTVVSILENVYHQKPEAILVSVRGYQFGFHRRLSTQTQALADQAFEKINNWLLEK
jgi:hydrogenase maturation protease